jgi:hypothetical protein
MDPSEKAFLDSILLLKRFITSENVNFIHGEVQKQINEESQTNF